MLTKLQRLPFAANVDNDIPDISFLTPEDQDRVRELSEQIDTLDPNKQPRKISAVVRELERLFSIVPVIGPSGRLGGPNLNIPRGLARYWERNRPSQSPGTCDFRNLKAVQKVRLVQLCRTYGWHGENPYIAEIVPLSEWDKEDRVEMNAFLDAADVGPTQDKGALTPIGPPGGVHSQRRSPPQRTYP